ncbi:MAG: hypothetical protein R2881_03155 [Eubacteriales bacterium]
MIGLNHPALDNRADCVDHRRKPAVEQSVRLAVAAVQEIITFETDRFVKSQHCLQKNKALGFVFLLLLVLLLVFEQPVLRQSPP